MEQKVTLYEPHPGFGGAIVPLPPEMKRKIDELDGKLISLDETIKILSLVAEQFNGTVEERENYLSFTFKTEDKMIHSYRLLRYK